MNQMNAMSQMGMNPMNMPMNPMQQQMMNAMSQMNPYAAAAAAYGNGYYANPFGYPVGQTLPTQRAVEKMRKSKQKFTVDGVSSRRFNEDVSNSTDESIHLVRSRKIGGNLFFILNICILIKLPFYSKYSLT
jgi:hypothetical protein